MNLQAKSPAWGPVLMSSMGKTFASAAMFPTFWHIDRWGIGNVCCPPVDAKPSEKQKIKPIAANLLYILLLLTFQNYLLFSQQLCESMYKLQIKQYHTHLVLSLIRVPQVHHTHVYALALCICHGYKDLYKTGKIGLVHDLQNKGSCTRLQISDLRAFSLVTSYQYGVR